MMKNEKAPIFCIAGHLDDGGSVIYTGVGYVIDKEINQDEYWSNNNKVFTWSIHSWFINI